MNEKEVIGLLLQCIDACIEMYPEEEIYDLNDEKEKIQGFKELKEIEKKSELIYFYQDDECKVWIRRGKRETYIITEAKDDENWFLDIKAFPI